MYICGNIFEKLPLYMVKLQNLEGVTDQDMYSIILLSVVIKHPNDQSSRDVNNNHWFLAIRLDHDHDIIYSYYLFVILKASYSFVKVNSSRAVTTGITSPIFKCKLQNYPCGNLLHLNFWIAFDSKAKKKNCIGLTGPWKTGSVRHFFFFICSIFCTKFMSCSYWVKEITKW